MPAEVRVRLIWKSLTPIVSSTGLRLEPNATFDACPQLDVVCAPGGIGINLLHGDQTPWWLGLPACSAASARRRIGPRTICSPPSARFQLTAVSCATAGIDFALTLVAELAGVETAQAIQLNLEYAPEPPFGLA
jgi:cyclohexyl-isocyanide hydratase